MPDSDSGEVVRALSMPTGDFGFGDFGCRALSMPKSDVGSGDLGRGALSMPKSDVGSGDGKSGSIVLSEGGKEPMCQSESSLGGSVVVPS